MTTYPTLTAAHAGCWFDCARGFYIGEAVIKEALAAGWACNDFANHKSDGEFYMEAWQDAEDFLAGLAPEGFWIGGNENGDFGMWESEED